MNASTFASAARAVGLALILAIAAAFGLAVGNALNSRANPDAGANIGGMVPGNAGGTPVSRIATAAFSIDALEAVQAARGDKAAATEDYVDYGLRHAAAVPAAGTSKESLAKPTLR